ncbi:hypothetical protein E2C01_069268 [Portunus trituberculatus]|uniref:Uncharacterized protein n=1 Tax=Portunus trituberculatus TaxID=210409 RepID=A0A5B7HYW3_PORTR|nr:hypothetical protein [Portunus trituberculatus]
MIRGTRAMIFGAKPGTLSHTRWRRSCYARQTAQQPRPSLINKKINSTCASIWNCICTSFY